MVAVATHRWSPTALYLEEGPCAPCLDTDCEAYIDADGRVHERGWPMAVNGLSLDIEDDPTGGVAKIVCAETAWHYALDSIPFAAGDTVVDIGAQVGVVSIYLASRYGATVYAYEPVPANFHRLCRNVEANGVDHLVTPVELAITGDGRPLTLTADPASNSGGASAFTASGDSVEVESTTLSDVFATHGIDWALLLKVDCEGAEYEVLADAPLDRVGYFRGELHTNDTLRAAGHDPTVLLDRLRRELGADRVHVSISEIAS